VLLLLLLHQFHSNICRAFSEPFLSSTAKLSSPLHDCRGWRVPREPTVLYRLWDKARSIGYARPEATPTG
jgi:hypothetical protein